MFDLLFPSYCINCGKPGELLCTECRKKLRSSLPECYVCRRVSSQYLTHKKCNKWNIDAVFIGWRYDSIAKKLLSQFKYRYAYKLSKLITKLLLDRLRNTGFIKLITPDSILMPIPSHISHFRKRGFNQSSLIAQGLSKSLGIRVEEECLFRDSDNRYQSQLSSDRRKNLGDIFSLKKEIIDRNILLIDDVVTTGTTVNRAAKVLKGNNIKVIALFRGKPIYQQMS